jgi:hypothetical protein
MRHPIVISMLGKTHALQYRTSGFIDAAQLYDELIVISQRQTARISNNPSYIDDQATPWGSNRLQD